MRNRAPEDLRGDRRLSLLPGCARRGRDTVWLCVAVLAMFLASALPAHARVTKIVIDDRQPLTGQNIPYERISGRAFGEIDPADPRNAIIQDIALGKDPDGKVRYVASFVLTKPADSTQASGLMWHDVPNRGRSITIVPAERNLGDVGLASAWQGDDSGSTAVGTTVLVGGGHWLTVPVAKNADGSPVTGRVLGRIVNRGGPGSQQIFVQTNPLPYRPATLDTAQATLVSRDRESMEGVVTGESVIPAGNWAWARCAGWSGRTPDPAQICLKNGFDPAKLYQVVFTARDPFILGIGFAAWRDVGSFFKYARRDDGGTPNPVGGQIKWSISRGVSQSGNFLRGWLHLGFNQDEAGRKVHDGMWPIIAGRRIALNFRWAQPDGVLELYQAGSEGPQWWQRFPDDARGLPPRGILDRCEATRTCPTIIEHFGAAEIWALKLGPEWVGMDARSDIPLPDNVRRYYIASTTHGGGPGGFDTSLPESLLARPQCPGNNYGPGTLPANPVPHAQAVNALRVHFRNWVMLGTTPPDSRYPMLRGPGGERHLVEPTKAAMGFPTIPGLRPTVPEVGFINAFLDYDWGPGFDPNDATGVPTNIPPRIRQVITMLVPRVNADGNELGGIPVVLLDAPLGTYVGWNVTAAGFHKDQICNYAGGMIPFARTQADRAPGGPNAGDPRLSLEERYTDHAGYVAAVRKAAANAVAQRFLLQEDAEALIAQAEASNVLK
jgi:hypothetical protein